MDAGIERNKMELSIDGERDGSRRRVSSSSVPYDKHTAGAAQIPRARDSTRGGAPVPSHVVFTTARIYLWEAFSNKLPVALLMNDQLIVTPGCAVAARGARPCVSLPRFLVFTRATQPVTRSEVFV